MDLKKHARLSLQFLETATNPEMGDLPYFWIDFLADPPEFMHCVLYDDVEDLGRWLYAIAAAQAVSGTSGAEETRRAMIREIDRRRTGPYGLVYTSEYSERYCADFKEHHSWLWGDRSVLQGWILSWRFSTDQNERDALKERIEEMVKGLNEFAVRIGDCTFFPSNMPGVSFQKRDDMIPPQEGCEESPDMYYAGVPSDPRVVPHLKDSTGE